MLFQRVRLNTIFLRQTSTTSGGKGILGKAAGAISDAKDRVVEAGKSAFATTGDAGFPGSEGHTGIGSEQGSGMSAGVGSNGQQQGSGAPAGTGEPRVGAFSTGPKGTGQRTFGKGDDVASSSSSGGFMDATKDKAGNLMSKANEALAGGVDSAVQGSNGVGKMFGDLKDRIMGAGKEMFSGREMEEGTKRDPGSMLANEEGKPKSQMNHHPSEAIHHGKQAEHGFTPNDTVNLRENKAKEDEWVVVKFPALRIMARPLATAATIGIVATTLYYLGHSVVPMIQDDSCGNGPYAPPSVDGSPEKFWRTNIPFLDVLNCKITPFFIDLVENPLGHLTLNIIMGIAGPILAIVAVEGSRSTTLLGASSTALIAFGGQFLGVSVVVPLFWLMSWYYSYPKCTVQPGGSRVAPHADPVVMGRILLGLVALSAVFLSVLLPVEFLKYIFPFFQFLPAVIPYIWSSNTIQTEPLPDTPETRAASRAIARDIYWLFSIGLALQWIYCFVTTVMMYVGGGDVALQYYELLATPWADQPKENMATIFICVECISLMCTMSVWIVSKGGLNSLARYWLGTTLLGPGTALALFALERENMLEKLISPGQATSEKAMPAKAAIGKTTPGRNQG
ncbi:hypothetical protein HK101_006948 [Irineochytrium annulatum]|nr:hypothetical protein HK101_006948 [Irineochytrium annulatum]